MHKVELHKRVQKRLKRIPENRRNQLVNSLEVLALSVNPSQHPNVKAMKGEMFMYHRMRVGDYRIVFQILDTEEHTEIKLLFVQNIDSRGNVY